ncbi:MAG: cation:proton antiporter [Candidatus Gracilibacteria bacterium]|nr:cation:proton antiporter [Candidatus Gracilibacteria bacterium]
MILEITITAILIATVFNIILNKFHMPTIIGYILTGTIIAYTFNLQDTALTYELKTLAEFGIVFLMFTIGLEFSMKHLIKMKKNVFVYGGLQFLVTSVVFIFYEYFYFD